MKGNHRSVQFDVASLFSNVCSEPVSKSSLMTSSEWALLTSLKPQETDCFDLTNSHSSLVNHLIESKNYSYLAHSFPQQLMNDSDLTNSHSSLANHLIESENHSYLAQSYSQLLMNDFNLTNSYSSLVNHLIESENHSYLAQPYSQLLMNDSNLMNSYFSLVNHLIKSENCSYLADSYLQQVMNGSGVMNTSLSSSSWFISSAVTVSGSEPQATVDFCDDLQVSVSSSYPVSYSYHHLSFSTKVSDEVLYTSGHSERSQISLSAEASPHTSDSAHTDEVTVARTLKVWKDGPHSSFHLSDSVPQGFDIIASMQLT